MQKQQSEIFMKALAKETDIMKATDTVLATTVLTTFQLVDDVLTKYKNSMKRRVSSTLLSTAANTATSLEATISSCVLSSSSPESDSAEQENRAVKKMASGDNPSLSSSSSDGSSVGNHTTVSTQTGNQLDDDLSTPMDSEQSPPIDSSLAAKSVATSPTASASPHRPRQHLFGNYELQLRDLQFDTCSMKAGSGLGLYVHHYRELDSSSKHDREKILRLAQEQGSLSNSLPLTWSSSVFVRVDEERMDFVKALITGPSDTPYGEQLVLVVCARFMSDGDRLLDDDDDDAVTQIPDVSNSTFTSPPRTQMYHR